MLEVWKRIPGHGGYEASNLGRIKSPDRLVRCGPWPGVRKANGRILKPFIAKKTGYTQVDIARQRFSVHRLVALAWCDGFFPGAWVNHKNSQREDNRADNLEWVTPSENAKHSYLSGRVNPCLGKFGPDHPSSKPVVSHDIKTGETKIYLCALRAAEEGFDSGSISKCCHGLQSTHKGRTWEFLESWRAKARSSVWHEAGAA